MNTNHLNNAVIGSLQNGKLFRAKKKDLIGISSWCQQLCAY